MIAAQEGQGRPIVLCRKLCTIQLLVQANNSRGGDLQRTRVNRWILLYLGWLTPPETKRA